MGITIARRMASAAALAVTIMLLTVCASVSADDAHRKAGLRPMHITAEAQAANQPLVDRLIVTPHPTRGGKLDGQLDRKNADHLNSISSKSMTVERKLGDGSHLLKLDQAVSIDEARAIAAQLQQSGEVQVAEPDLMMHVQSITPNDPAYASWPGQWNYLAPSGGNRGGANVPGAWDITLGSGNIDVAVIDTGYRPHIDLQQMLPGYDFISKASVGNDGDGRDADASDPGDYAPAGACGSRSAASDSTWHGTHVMGTVAALMDNGLYGTGIAPNVRILPLRALGRCGGYTSDIVDAIRWAAGIDIAGVPHNNNPARVINLSLGSAGACSNAFQRAINDVNAKGAIVVVATGNGGSNVINQPANCTGVIAVTAHSIDGDSAEYANIGAETTISAPGGGCGTQAVSCVSGYSADGPAVYSLGNSGSATPMADSSALKYGTSMAVPHVVGTIALMLSVNPSLSRAQVTALLRSSARAFPAASACNLAANTNLCGAGLIDARAAVASVAGVQGNRIPVLAPVADQQVSFGATLRLQLLASDADGNPISFHASDLPAGASLSSGGLLIWLSAAPVGSRSIHWTASNSYGSSLPGQFTVNVIDSSSGSNGLAPVGGGGSMRDDLLLVFACMVAVIRRWRRQ
jgi:serine protease